MHMPRSFELINYVTLRIDMFVNRNIFLSQTSQSLLKDFSTLACELTQAHYNCDK
jgi:hypothetical protein